MSWWVFRFGVVQRGRPAYHHTRTYDTEAEARAAAYEDERLPDPDPWVDESFDPFVLEAVDYHDAMRQLGQFVYEHPERFPPIRPIDPRTRTD